MSAFWFCSLGALGIFFPFYSLYLRENIGLTGWQVGAVLAVPPLVAVVAQPAWGVLADRTGSRARVLGLLHRWDDPELAALLERLRREHPDHAPGRFLEERRRLAQARALDLHH